MNSVSSQRMSKHKIAHCDVNYYCINVRMIQIERENGDNTILIGSIDKTELSNQSSFFSPVSTFALSFIVFFSLSLTLYFTFLLCSFDFFSIFLSLAMSLFLFLAHQTLSLYVAQVPPQAFYVCESNPFVFLSWLHNVHYSFNDSYSTAPLQSSYVYNMSSLCGMEIVWE